MRQKFLTERVDELVKERDVKPKDLPENLPPEVTDVRTYLGSFKGAVCIQVGDPEKMKITQGHYETKILKVAQDGYVDEARRLAFEMDTWTEFFSLNY